MRITGGELRGRILPGRVPAGVRPTSARVREALFSILGPELPGASVLDPFGGTGLLSFEALSRGASHARVLERQRRVAGRIRAAAEALGLAERTEVVVTEVPRGLGRDTWDVVLVDPPYALDPEPILRALEPRVGGLLVLEHTRRIAAPQLEELALDRSRRYGDTVLSIYRRA